VAKFIIKITLHNSFLNRRSGSISRYRFTPLQLLKIDKENQKTKLAFSDPSNSFRIFNQYIKLPLEKTSQKQSDLKVTLLDNNTNYYNSFNIHLFFIISHGYPSPNSYKIRLDNKTYKPKGAIESSNNVKTPILHPPNSIS